ncbi:hypothetical protein Q787_03575 [Ornithobacterium rhinotracheale H06-030791]|nr:hypothetical protein Q785_03700 [Ornithobacterium rhinotracheale ORT-UMN 88]AIQ00683.1 hypothetical protein Q785_09800 [Ornithobacterium rhinotracheale ORT-UMN 88]KGB66328.1 hypothetical protein Q787_09620 [Ornithobacterium rhinotracheale H06-030791]KGB67278.1 hypothetical protein Q787_03575 [Ornithobacterium rhinotracheale H06-030791]
MKKVEKSARAEYVNQEQVKWATAYRRTTRACLPFSLGSSLGRAPLRLLPMLLLINASLQRAVGERRQV